MRRHENRKISFAHSVHSVLLESSRATSDARMKKDTQDQKRYYFPSKTEPQAASPCPCRIKCSLNHSFGRPERSKRIQLPSNKHKSILIQLCLPYRSSIGRSIKYLYAIDQRGGKRMFVSCLSRQRVQPNETETRQGRGE